MFLSFLQQADSSAVAVAGAAVTSLLVAKLALGYGIVNKFVTDLTSKAANALTGFEAKLSPTFSGFVTAALAYLGSVGIALLNSEVTKFGIPAASDVAHINVFVMGALGCVASMGAHSFFTKVLNIPSLGDFIAGLFTSASSTTPTSPTTTTASK